MNKLAQSWLLHVGKAIYVLCISFIAVGCFTTVETTGGSGSGSGGGSGSGSGSTYTTLTYYNNTYTSVSITVNSLPQTITSLGNVVYPGTKSTSATGTASTSGATTSGTQIGSKITWTLSNTFPSTGNSSVNLDVASDYFFLKIANSSTKSITKVYVNYGLTTQSLDNLSIPNNGTTYIIGYYKAFTNSNVRLEAADGTFWTFSSLGLPFTKNQSTTVTAH